MDPPQRGRGREMSAATAGVPRQDREEENKSRAETEEKDNKVKEEGEPQRGSPVVIFPMG